MQLCIVRKGGHIIIALQNTLLVDGSKTIYAVSFSYIYKKKELITTNGLPKIRLVLFPCFLVSVSVCVWLNVIPELTSPSLDS